VQKAPRKYFPGKMCPLYKILGFKLTCPENLRVGKEKRGKETYLRENKISNPVSVYQPKREP